MFRHVKDKFGNSLLFQRSRLETVLEDTEHVNVGNKRLRYVADPEEEHDSVNRGYVELFYVEKSKHEELVNRVNGLEEQMKKCLQLTDDRTAWDAKNKKIGNVAAGDSFGDVSTFDQTLTYDRSVMNFKTGDIYFNLVESSANKPVLTATTDSAGDLIFAPYGSELEVIPNKSIRWDYRYQIAHDQNGEIVWDETVKRFAYRHTTAWGQYYPHPHVLQLPLIIRSQGRPHLLNDDPEARPPPTTVEGESSI